MCGRFVSSNHPDKIAEYFDASFQAEPIPANFNVAPTNDVYGVVALPGTQGEQREVQAFHWGLVPSWAKDVKIGSKMINARGETVAEKPAFKSAFVKHRMIIPMDGFYEWQQGSEGATVTKKGKPAKQPYFIHSAMPVMLPQSTWAAWLDPDNHDADALKELLAPADDDLLVMHPVSTEVNNVRNKDEHLVDEIDPDAPTPTEDGQLPLG